MSKLVIIATWLATAMHAWAPEQPARTRFVEGGTRYDAIARTIAEVAYDADEPPLFKGPDGRARTALLLTSIASLESNFEEEVDAGRKRGDHGDSVCLLQVRLPGRSRITMQGDVYGYSYDAGWSAEDVASDRTKCVRAALHIARESFRICHDLSMYTTGHCQPKELTATNRMKRAVTWWNRTPTPALDAELFAVR